MANSKEICYDTSLFRQLEFMKNQLFFLFRDCLNQVVSVKSTAKLCIGKLDLVGHDVGYIEITRLNHKDFRMRAVLKLVQRGIQVTLQQKNDDNTWTNYASSVTGACMQFWQPRDRIAQAAVDVMMVCDILAQQQTQKAA